MSGLITTEETSRASATSADEPVARHVLGLLTDVGGMVSEESSERFLSRVSHETPPASVTPSCQFCAEDGEFALASIRFDGALACAFHSYSFYYDQPARRWAQLEADHA